MRYRFIKDFQGTFSIAAMCRVLQVSSSGYYAWIRRGASQRSRENQNLLNQIKAIHKESRQTYGPLRIYDALKDRGAVCGRHRVARLMRKHGIRVKRRRRYKVTTDSRHALPIAANVLDRQFDVHEPNQVWGADVTFIPTRQGWLYLAVVLDLFSRRVVGWSMSRRNDRALVTSALKMALNARRPEHLLHHSDRGSTYASNDYQTVLRQANITCSMSRKGNCWDNAPVESFFATIKRELIHHCRYQTRDEARRDIFEYIEVFYNRQRKHSSIAYLSPAQYEQQYQLA